MIADAQLEHFANTGLETASDAFHKLGQSPNAVLLINEEGNLLFVPYLDVEERMSVRLAALLHKARAAVLIGEAWYREIPKDEERTHARLKDDPQASEEVFALAVRAGTGNSYRTSRQILRDGDKAVLVDRAKGWTDGHVESWLLDTLNQISVMFPE